MSLPAPPVYGLVLAGGRSTRMRRDKAALAYHGRTQLDWALALLAPHLERTFISVRPEQSGDAVRAHFPQILDTHANLGPIAGILAAQATFPQAAWLVLACDLPFLDEGTLQHLLRSRDPRCQATAFRSSHDGLPEPLCTIYEPSSRLPLAAYVAAGTHCPRKFLLAADAKLIDGPSPRALENINTPEEYAKAMAHLSPEAGAGARKHIAVQYYALLREQAGRSEERLLTAARTPLELYAELKTRYPFSLSAAVLRVAVNEEFGAWSQSLADGDSVVFIPPVAGG